MHEVTAEEQQRLERLLRKHRKRLLAYPNVHSVDVGLEFSDGRPTGRLALRVHVTEKVAEGALSRAHRVPDELDGVPVDVIQFNPRPQQNRNQRHDPVMGGVQIMNTSRTKGGNTRHDRARSPQPGTAGTLEPSCDGPHSGRGK